MKTVSLWRRRQERANQSWGGTIWRVNLVAACLLMTAVPHARAAVWTYYGDGLSGVWTDELNWVPYELFGSGPPNGSDIRIRGDNFGGGHNPVVDHAWSIESLRFIVNPDGDSSYTLNGHSADCFGGDEWTEFARQSS